MMTSTQVVQTSVTTTDNNLSQVIEKANYLNPGEKRFLNVFWSGPFTAGVFILCGNSARNLFTDKEKSDDKQPHRAHIKIIIFYRRTDPLAC